MMGPALQQENQLSADTSTMQLQVQVSARNSCHNAMQLLQCNAILHHDLDCASCVRSFCGFQNEQCSIAHIARSPHASLRVIWVCTC